MKFSLREIIVYIVLLLMTSLLGYMYINESKEGKNKDFIILAQRTAIDSLSCINYIQYAKPSPTVTKWKSKTVTLIDSTMLKLLGDSLGNIITQLNDCAYLRVYQDSIREDDLSADFQISTVGKLDNFGYSYSVRPKIENHYIHDTITIKEPCDKGNLFINGGISTFINGNQGGSVGLTYTKGKLGYGGSATYIEGVKPTYQVHLFYKLK